MRRKAGRAVVAGGVLAGALCLGLYGIAQEAGEPGAAARKQDAPAVKGPSEDVTADFIRKVMKMNAELSELNRKIEARKRDLYEQHAEIKKLRAEMLALQARINEILDADEELSALAAERDTLWTLMPEMPKAKGPMGMPPFPGMQPGAVPPGGPKLEPPGAAADAPKGP